MNELFCAPGNPGIAEVADCVPVSPGDIVEIADLAEKLKLDLTVVGPELPLALGIGDEFGKRDLPIFGPSRLAAQIEASKVFAKEFLRRHGLPTAEAHVCASREEAQSAVKRMGYPAVLKADGLAGGKGVLIAESREESDRALALFFDERVFGSAGDRVLVEEFLTGSEVTFLAVAWARILLRAISTRLPRRKCSERSSAPPSPASPPKAGRSAACCTRA